MSFYYVLLMLFCLSFLYERTTASTTPSVLPGVTFIGKGYNAITGNPLSIKSGRFDPGFASQVLHLHFSASCRLNGKEWSIPDHVECTETPACGLSVDYTNVTGAKRYQAYLAHATEFSGGGGLPPFVLFAFTGNVQFNKSIESVSRQHMVDVIVMAKCAAYRVKSNEDLIGSYRLTGAFSRAVEALPDIEDDAEYFAFIDQYGTHFVTEVDLGSKTTIRSQFESSTWLYLSREAFDIGVQAAAVAVFKIAFKVHVSTLTSQEKQAAEMFKKTRKLSQVISIGAHIPDNGNMESWKKRTEANPTAIHYKLTPLTELFTEQYVPLMNSEVLSAKLKLLTNAFNSYCMKRGCGIPPPDRIPLEMVTNKVKIKWSQTMHCQPGFSLLSCGIENAEIDQPDPQRYVIPASNTSCKCSDTNGAICRPWCAKGVSGMEIVTSEGYAICPDDTQVLGCHAIPATEWKEHWYYPTDDHSGCRCSNDNGTLCIATCGSDIRKHEVRPMYGRGVFTVTCASSDNVVLGCGIKPHVFGGPENWRACFAEPYNACKCEDYFGATCYAICGLL